MTMIELLIPALGFVLFPVFLYAVWQAIYNLYFHPLSKFPGPKVFGASRIPITLALLTGRIGHTIKNLHEKYGPVVRTAPDELVFSSSVALKDIYTRHGPKPAFAKDPVSYTVPPSGVHSILTVRDDRDHSRYRRLLAHAFSDHALHEQAPLIKKYVDLLMSRLRSAEGPQDMVDWFNFVAFDIIGDLTLGESFNCLQDSKCHPWVSYLLVYFKSSSFLAATRRYPLFAPLLMKFIPKEVLAGRFQHAAFTKEKVEKRMAMGNERGDFMSNVLKHNEKETGMTKEEIISTFSILLLGGSETTATALSAAIYYLSSFPSKMQKLKEEVRSSFTSEHEITQISVNKLKYLLAVLEETLRMHPPVPRGGPRIVPTGGEYVDGIWIPGGTNVSVPAYSAMHQSSNWSDPETFAPERWLYDPKYKSDDRAASAPFSLGPRNCIGRNLANAEMRLILARLIWNFDIELEEESKTWGENQKMYLMWDKPPLMVILKNVGGNP